MILQRLGIDVVGGCNLKCVGCPNSTLDRKIRFTTPENFNLQLSNINVERIEFLKLYNFGETLLHPNLDEILAQIPKQKWNAKHIEMSTNGQVVDIKKLSAIFSSKIITRFGISCDGDCTPEEYMKLRKGARWEKLIEFMILAQEMRRKYNSKTKMFLKIFCTGNKLQWKKLAKDMDYRIQWRRWMKPPDSIKFMHTKRKKVNGVCNHVRSTKIRCYVDWDGVVVPCCCYPRAGVFGSLKKQKFTEIYGGDKRKAFIRKLRRNRQSHQICKNCEAK